MLFTKTTVKHYLLKQTYAKFLSLNDFTKQEHSGRGNFANGIKLMISLISMVTKLTLAPESRILIRSCTNLNQFFLVTVLILPENFVAVLSYTLNQRTYTQNVFLLLSTILFDL